MNDYSFGNHLFALRQQAGLSQKEAAVFLGVTNKAVSKWENGRSMPAVGIIRKLAELYQVSVEELLKERDEVSGPEITKIVITGGPCAGKTTAMSWIQNEFTRKGYAVLFVPETATELIGGGVAPWTCGSGLDYQACQMQLQAEKERIFEEAARTMKAEKVLIVCDRGQMDNLAYMTRTEFETLLHRMNWEEIQLRDGYDAVFHLVTAAKGALEAYTLSNNAARTETPEQAALLDDRLISAWTGHPHFRVIDNSTDFQDKMRRLLGEISAFLGEPEPMEIERKFLIAYPDIAALERDPNCRRVEIIQTYPTSREGEETRVRQRGAGGSYIYTETTKRAVSAASRVEVERRLTQREYLERLMDADPARRPIRKTRYCLTWAGQYFELDVYPFWRDRAILEIERREENTPIVFPDHLRIIREVTGDPAYGNAELARI